MTENIMESTVLMDEVSKEASYCFNLPTKATRLEPVFVFTFQLNRNTFSVSLNPKLCIENSSMNYVRKFCFTEDGSYVFNNEEFGSYFIQGEVRQVELNSQITEKSCFLRLTYGKNDEALHYIKGNFQLMKIGE